MKTNRHRNQQHAFYINLLKVDNTSEKNVNNNVNKHKQRILQNKLQASHRIYKTAFQRVIILVTQ